MPSDPRFYDLTISDDSLDSGSLFITGRFAAINFAVSRVLGSSAPGVVETAGRYVFSGHLSATKTFVTGYL